MKRKWTQEEINFLKEKSYLFTIKELGLILNRTYDSIYPILKKYSLSYKKQHLDYNSSRIFIENKRKEDERSFWYLIGFIAGDGYIYKNKKCIKIVQKKPEILNKIDIYLEGRTRFKKEGNLWRLDIYLPYLIEFCKNIGITSNKSKTLKIKKGIPEKYFGDFLRGVFDSDGGVNIYFKENKYSFYCDITSASLDFVNYISNELNRRKINHSIKDDKKAYRIRFTNFESIKNLYLLFYVGNPFLYIERKKNNFQKLLSTLSKNKKEVLI